MSNKLQATSAKATLAVFKNNLKGDASVYDTATYTDELYKAWNHAREALPFGLDSRGKWLIILKMGGRSDQALTRLLFDERLSENQKIEDGSKRLAPFELMNNGKKSANVGVLEVSARQLYKVGKYALMAELTRQAGIAQMLEHDNKVISRVVYANKLAHDTFEQGANKREALYRMVKQDVKVDGISEMRSHHSSFSRGFEIALTKSGETWTDGLSASERPIETRVNFEVFQELKRNIIEKAEKTPSQNQGEATKKRDDLQPAEDAEPTNDAPKVDKVTHVLIKCRNEKSNPACLTKFEIGLEYLQLIYATSDAKFTAKLPKCGHCDAELIVDQDTQKLARS